MPNFSVLEKAFSKPSANSFGVEVYDNNDAPAIIKAILAVICIAFTMPCSVTENIQKLPITSPGV